MIKLCLNVGFCNVSSLFLLQKVFSVFYSNFTDLENCQLKDSLGRLVQKRVEGKKHFWLTYCCEI